jgi:isoleucyl-tRNA synthetase
MASYDPKAVEPAVLAFWTRNKIYQKAKEQVASKKSYYFLDGPPYTSGKVHIGTSWNKALKDMVLRYKRMAGFDVWDRAGYDMHGLPTENKVKKKFGLQFSQDIEQFGVAKFNDECEKFAVEMMGVMNQTFKRLGVWMDFDNAYQPITREFISGEWFLIKKAHEQKRLYEALRTMPWCAHCQTSLAKHDLEYATVTDTSIFVKFPVKGKKNEFLIIWTTTPWTIPLNLAVMVNPELDYVRAKVDNETWILAKALANVVVTAVAEKQIKILEEFKGETLECLEYTHPFSDVIPEYKELKKDAKKLHTVILSEEYVDTSAGSGLVHCAPGCGPEDYEVGHRNGLPAWNFVDERGKFPAHLKEFGGLTAKKDDDKFIEALKKRGALIATTKVEHEYAHCQRCHNPIIFRTTKQWFFKVEDLKDKLIESNKRIAWVPDAGFNAFESWLKNLRDNSITRQNFWGTPVPIWKCTKCDSFDVYGSLDELEHATKTKVTKFHKPWIDELKYKCSCGAMKHRIPDVLDVWVDAGTTAWNCLDYPKRDDLFKKLYPADFILEGKDQIRGWFNMLHIASMIAFGKPAFKAVYMHGFIDDALGRKMSKSLGNQIEPEEVIKDWGSDALRYYQIGAAQPGLDQLYNFEDIKLKYKNLLVLWNVHNYLIDLAKVLGVTKVEKHLENLDTPERYILSKLNTTIKNATHAFDTYHLNEVPWLIEDLYLELSRTYIQLVRDKVATGTDEEKLVVFNTLYHVLMDTLLLMSPITPFFTEQMYQNLKQAFNLKEESVHLVHWPSFDEKQIDSTLERHFRIAGNVMQAALFAREKIKLGVRWPVKGVIVVTTASEVKDAVKQLADVIKTQTNVKEIHVQESLPEVKEEVRIHTGVIGKDFKQHAPAIIKELQSIDLHKAYLDVKSSGKHDVKHAAGVASLTAQHFQITRAVPSHLVEVPFTNGIVYLDQEPSDELEAEGYAREVTRRIQEARKKAGLEKKDVIDLHIEAQPTLQEMLVKWKDSIKEKVNAKNIVIEMLPPGKKHVNRSTEQVKDEIFSIHFTVV